MKRAMWCVALCVSIGLGVAQGQDLRIDFSQTNGPVEAGYQAYRADHEVPATFTAQSFAAFGATVTITPTWAAGATAAAMQMIERPDDDASEAPNLVRDWIGTDGRQPGDPMTLTISGLPAGTYKWVSLHHDPQDQTGVFDVTVNDAAGSTTTTDLDISDLTPSGVLLLADMTTFTTTVVSNGTDPVTLVWQRTSPIDPVGTAFFVMNSFELTIESSGGAMLPTPAHQAVDVRRDGTIFSWMPGENAVSHDVYLGTVFADVNAAGTADAVYRGRQDATSYDPGRLELGQTYFWRIDEVHADGTVVAGSVWSFTVEPVSVPLTAANITATASSAQPAMGPENTVNGSGLNANDEHSTELTEMWMSAGVLPNWIQYDFDALYKLDEMRVWNSNQMIEPFIGFGAKDVTIEYSTDGETWTMLEGVPEFAQAIGTATYTANTVVDFGGATARHVKLTINQSWGGVAPQTGLSEVRFLVLPVRASEPQPESGATSVDPRLVLAWRAGREAAEHQVYLSTDANEVLNGTALADTVSEPRLDAGSLLALGRTYYWKVNEVNDAEEPAVWEGDVWSFTTSAFLPVDDMESYNDAEGQDTRIYETWLDGWDVPANGSQVGHDTAPFAEKVIVHGGTQSMPLRYDNSTASYSEATRTFDEPQDWTQFGVKGLVVWFYGDSANTAAQMYVKVNGNKVVYDGDAGNLQQKPWQMWYIDLASFSGVNLANVTSLTLGFEGGAGIVYFDDIGLTPLDRQLVTPVQPAATNLVGHFAFEGDVKDATGKLTATVTGAPTYVAGKVGQAIHFDGVRDWLMVESSFNLPTYSAALWFLVDGGSGNRDLLSIYDSAGGHGILLEITATGQVRYLHRPVVGTGGGQNIYSTAGYADGAWYHVALVKSTDAITLYINGEPAGSVAESGQFDKTLARLVLGQLRHDSIQRFLPGAMDEVYLYSRALSEAEIAWLAGRTKPYDKP